MTQPEHTTEVHVREHPLPGAARLFHLTLSDDHVVSVMAAAETDRRQLSVSLPHADEPVVVLDCSGPEASTIASLLTGIRFVVAEADDSQPDDAAALRTITLPAGSPAIGLRLHDLVVPNPELARVIAVIRDDTADLIETDVDRPCQPGDRLVLIGRPSAMGALVRSLVG